MQQLLKWSLDTIRENDSCFSWMEEFRYEWSPLVKSAVSQAIDGKAVLVLTDESCEWFAHYIISSINDLYKQRPLLPFYSVLQHPVFVVSKPLPTPGETLQSKII